SGQWQPEINSVRAPVVDPADATIKWFFKGDMLYLGVDVRDQAVWGLNQFDLWDGIRFIINDRAAVDPGDNNLLRRELTVRVDSLGQLMVLDYLPMLIDSFKTSKAAMALKPGTTVNNFNDIDAGYSFELAIDLTKLGYPVGRGDGALFISATLFDGDAFANPADTYGNRVWWMRESSWPAAPAWAYMDPNAVLTGVKEIAGKTSNLPTKFAVLGNYPNPFNPSSVIRYALPEDSRVTLKVYNVLGSMVAEIPLGLQKAGINEVTFNAEKISSGIYFYHFQAVSGRNNKLSVSSTGKMVVLK
ncbi:MAG: T9SS type A sorting domain-containing protein, partial [candidate division KSB1 bacterium]|nr:T9SS type A sorting domain-containing protein [candidate division KSB1 bacterium]